MNQLNSFTSSSDNMNLRRVGGAIYVAAWVVIGLVVIDILINLVLAYPTDPMITTLSAMTWSFDLPMPYTTDRFFLDDNQLRVVHPPYGSFERYVEAFSEPAKWSSLRELLAKNDTMYNSFIMRANILDHSSL